MGMRRAQGWALIISALLGLLAILNSDSPVLRVLLIVGGVLLILGVPAIAAVQHMGTLGMVGIILIELAAIIALVVNIMAMGGSVAMGEAIPLASALAGALGRVIVGWLTTRENVFSAWVGWAFIAEGILNLLGGFVSAAPLGAALGVLLPIVGAAALIGYGLGIVRNEAGAAA